MKIQNKVKNKYDIDILYEGSSLSTTLWWIIYTERNLENGAKYSKAFFFEKKFVRNKDIWKKKYSMKEQLFNQLSRGETTVL